MPNRNLFVMCFAIFLAGGVHSALQAAEDSDPRYLSDSLSDRIVWTTQNWGELGLNASAAASRESARKLRIKDKEYAHGLGHHANGEIAFDLGGQFKTFQTDVGIQWIDGKGPGSVVFQIFADGKKVFDSGVMRENDPPRPVTVSVEGADELRLVANDAGDGINSDCADWADARLTRNPAAATNRVESAVDVAPFARVLSWDPKSMEGTRATRFEAMPAKDVAPYKEILPSADKTYAVPTADGAGSIGLQWNEDRFLRRVAIQFSTAAAVLPAESVQLQFWTGESAWQGRWQSVTTLPEKVGDSLLWQFGFQESAVRTQKVRWVFSGVKQPIAMKSISAFTRSLWKAVNVKIEAAGGSAKPAKIEVYNGIFLTASQESSSRCTWDGSEPLLLKVLASTPQQHKNDRTVLRFQMPDAAFGVAVEDLLANDCVYVPHANVFVTRVPSPVTPDEYLKKIAGRKTVLEEVRQKPDRDFSQAWALIHNPGQDHPPTLLSLACDNRKFLVDRDGTVLFNEYDHPDDPPGIFDGVHAVAANLGQWRFVPGFGGGQPLPISRHLDGGWLPIPVTTAQDKNIAYRQTTFVVPASGPVAGKPAWLRERAVCAIEYQVKNTGTEASDARLVLRLVSAKDPNQSVRYYKVGEGFVVTNNNRGMTINNDRVLAMIDTREAGPLLCKQGPEGIVVSGTLPGGGSARYVVYLPAWKVAPTDYALLMQHNRRTSRVEEYWKSLLEPAMQIDIPDPLLSNIIRASQVHCMLAARNEDRCELIAPWISSTYYGPLDTESTSVVRGMDMLGHAEFAQRGLEYLLKQCNLDDFIALNYTLTGNGEVLWNVGEHYRRTGDKEWLRKIAPEVVRICQWVMHQRAKTKSLDAHGRSVPEFGLAPPGVSADWNRFAYRFFNDAQYCYGLQCAGRALADIGDPAGETILTDANRYREDIGRALHWTRARSPVVPLRSGTWVPDDPPLLGYFGSLEGFLPGEDASRSWCYGIELGSHHLAVNRVIDPMSKHVDWMVDYLEDVRFLHTKLLNPPEKAGYDAFTLGGYAKQQPYYCRITELHALRDDVKPFLRSYFNAIPSVVCSEDLTFWEELQGNDIGCGAFNKTHETGWFLSQTHTMFVADRGDELWLAPFVTNRWLKDGMKVSVHNAPTGFGKIGYAITSAAAKGWIEAVVQLPEECTARKIVLRLRHPEGKPIQSVAVDGKPHKDFDPKKETITLAPTGGTMKVRAQY